MDQDRVLRWSIEKGTDGGCAMPDGHNVRKKKKVIKFT